MKHQKSLLLFPNITIKQYRSTKNWLLFTLNPLSLLMTPYQIAWNLNNHSQICDHVRIKATVDGTIPQFDAGVGGVNQDKARINERRNRDPTFG